MSLRYIIKKCAALFVLPLLFAGFSAARADSVPDRAVVYTALGDSISTGYELNSPSDSYVSLLGKYLGTTPENLGQNGLDSAGLLNKLNKDQKVIDRLKKSDVITVSMGGNDMLRIFAQLQPTSVTELLKTVGEIQNSSMEKKLGAGVQTFNHNWPKVYGRLIKLNPHAKIIVTTLINPYQGITVRVPYVVNFDFGAFSDKYVKQINAIIKKDAPGHYLVADSYSLFQSHTDQKLTHADLNKLNFDPHPNTAGHALIFQAHKSVKILFTNDAAAVEGPRTVEISPYAPAASASYTVKPLLSCFGASTAVAYSLKETGKTEAAIDPATGVLTAKNPGTVQIAASLSMPGTNLTAQTTATVRITKAAGQRKATPGWLPVAAGAATLTAALLAVVFFAQFRKRR